VMNDGDVFPEREEQITSVIDMTIRKACNM